MIWGAQPYFWKQPYPFLTWIDEGLWQVWSEGTWEFWGLEIRNLIISNSRNLFQGQESVSDRFHSNYLKLVNYYPQCCRHLNSIHALDQSEVLRSAHRHSEKKQGRTSFGPWWHLGFSHTSLHIPISYCKKPVIFETQTTQLVSSGAGSLATLEGGQCALRVRYCSG